jgi:2-polyprenyl-3-methyl-5-hydroxy-6-metoxy-1,4-benzoquinol methylase
MSDNSLEVEKKTVWDHSSDQNFVDYYAEQSTSPNTIQRFSIVRDKALRLLTESHRGAIPAVYSVADIGCGTGTQARLWADLGHRVYAIDVNSALVDIGRRRAINDGAKT